MQETTLMRQLFKLAKRYEGFTKPNPMVAAAVVKNGRVIAKGAHSKAGEPHAEIIALKKAGKLAKGATLFVTLEPCTHSGKTPPCCQVIIDAGIAEVIFAVQDPNPLARGAKKVLEKAGIKVRWGVLEEEAILLNAVFFKKMTQKKPFVSLKWAQSLDGKIALENGKSKYLTSESALKEVHRLRRNADAVLVGSGTIKLDDPGLDVRYGIKGPSPAKVVFTSNGDISTSAKLFSTPGPVFLVVDEKKMSPELQKKWQNKATLIPVKKTASGLNIEAALQKIGMDHYMIEGGTSLASSAIQSGLVDRVDVFIAPKLLMGPKDKVPLLGPALQSLDEALVLKHVVVTPRLPDILISGYLKLPHTLPVCPQV